MCSYVGTGTIQVYVGAEQKVFEVHRTLLFSQSPFCAAQVKFSGSHTIEAIKLPNITVPNFNIMFNWLYTGRLNVAQDETQANGTRDDLKFMGEDLIELYHSADIMMMQNLQNTIVDHDLARLSKTGCRTRVSWDISFLPNWHEAQLAHTPYYRLFMADVVRYYFESGYDRNSFEQTLKSLSEYPEAMFDLLDAMDKYRRKPWSRVDSGDKCRWHIHENDERCD